MNDKYIYLKWWHGGKIVKEPKAMYVGGSVIEDEAMDCDLISYFELIGRAKKLEIKNVSKLMKYYSLGEKHQGFNQLCDDNDVRFEVSLLEDGETLELYVEHEEASTEATQNQQLGNNESSEILEGNSDMPQAEVECEDEGCLQSRGGSPICEAEPSGIRSQSCVYNPFSFINLADLFKKKVPILDLSGQCGDHMSEDRMVNMSPIRGSPRNSSPQFEAGAAASEPQETDSSSSSSEYEGGGVVASENEEEVVAVRSEVRNLRRRLRASNKEGVNNIDYGEAGPDEGFRGEDQLQDRYKGKTGNDEAFYDSSDPDSRSQSVSDDEQDLHGDATSGRRRERNLHYDPETAVPYWELGMIFESVGQFRQAVSKYSIARGLGNLKLRPNEAHRVRVKCKPACPWLLYASIESSTGNFTIQTYNPQHRCTRTNRNKLATAKYIAGYFKERILSQPSVKIREIQKWCEDSLKVYVGRSIVQRAKKKVLKEAMGDPTVEFAKLHHYCEEIKRSNPGSTCFAECVRIDDKKQIFKRFYICLHACKAGFLNGCRPIIGLDGCFLKGVSKGQLLCAVSKDANGQMFPIAWGIIDIENTDNWKWFVSKLKLDIVPLGTSKGQGWTLVIDMQKGLDKAIDAELPEAEHRMCARHIWDNWRKKWRGEERRLKFWEIARAPFEAMVKDKLKELNNMGKGIVEDLIYYNPQLWCRTFFSTTSKCDVVENNMSETFNSWILNARYKSIVSMCEDIRTHLMERIRKMREFANCWICDISLIAMERLEKNKLLAMKCSLVWNGESGFEIVEGTYKHTIDIDRRTCTCRSWELKGIPCQHGVCALFHLKLQPEDYVSEWYHKSTFLTSYATSIQPIRGLNLLPDADYPEVLPPIIEQQKAGKPKLTKRKDKDEPTKRKIGKLSKKGLVMNCKVCGEAGHNKRSCKNKGPSTVAGNDQTQTQWSANTSAPAAGNEAAHTTVTAHTRKKSRLSTSVAGTSVAAGTSTAATSSATPASASVQSGCPAGHASSAPELRNVGTRAAPRQGLSQPRRSTGFGLCFNEHTGVASLQHLNRPERVVITPSEVKSSAVVTGDLGFKAPGLKWKGKPAVTAATMRMQTRSLKTREQEQNPSSQGSTGSVRIKTRTTKKV